jgi:protein SCO1
MPAMTMPFDVSVPVPIMQPGDRLRATLVLGSDNSRLEDIVVTAKASGPVLPPLPAVREPQIGDEVPDFHLRNQDDSPIHVQQFKGRVVLLTFIYTRCPLPDFCPLMMKHFDAVNRSMVSRPDLRQNVQLLGVSVDPEYDTPAVLRAYGKAFITGRDPFERLDLATGAPAEIRKMATYFGLTYAKDSAAITHSLSTAIIGTDGRIVSVLPSNSWRPKDALDMIDMHLRTHRQVERQHRQ